ncbi:MAG: hypothetical protein IJQ66_05045, partial [Clostridia bacterium]|nr:hypothetical protein [Clostridia bacterium]
ADVKETIEFCYSNGAKAVCKADCISDRQTDVWIEGDEGKILIDSVTCPCHIEVYDKNGQVVKTIDCAPKFGGFEYELWSCKRAIDSGKTECHEWTHNDSIETSKIVEKVLNYANNIRE